MRISSGPSLDANKYYEVYFEIKEGIAIKLGKLVLLPSFFNKAVSQVHQGVYNPPAIAVVNLTGTPVYQAYEHLLSGQLDRLPLGRPINREDIWQA